MRAAVLEDTPPAAPPGPAAAPEADAEVHDRRTEPLEEDLDRLSGKSLDELERALGELEEEDVADIIQLGFGLLADSPGMEHWEISPARATRLARWVKRVLDRHLGTLGWVKAWLPEIMTGLLLGYEIWTRIRIGKQKRAAAQKPEPAQEVPDGPSADS